MGIFTIDPATVDVNLIYLGLVISLWVAVTGAYVPGTGVIETVALVGVAGSLVLLAQLPTNWVAVLLLVMGVSGFIVMPFIREQYAVLALGGLVLQAGGAFFLFDGMAVSPLVIALTLAIPFAYHQGILMPMLRSINREPIADKDELLIGKVGRVTKTIDPIGTVNIESELWTATSETTVEAGERVLVIDRDGLQLIVEPVKRKRTLNGLVDEVDVSSLDGS
jgi:membrane-bound ClpP family serine protease